MKTTPLIFLAIFLSGCAGGGHVYKPGATAEQVAADNAACRYEMLKSTGGANTGDPIGVGMAQGEIFNACLTSKGYK